MSSTSTQVYVPHQDLVWALGQIVSESDGVAHVRIIDQDASSDKIIDVAISKFESKALPLHNSDMSVTGVEDMCSLSYLHEPSILDNLRRRFINRSPYTYAGEICIAVNPYQWFDNYNNELR